MLNNKSESQSLSQEGNLGSDVKNRQNTTVVEQVIKVLS